MNEISGDWFTSSYSTGANNCVEARISGDGTVQIRDTKDLGRGPVLVFSAQAWTEFLPMATVAA
jgi:hypothetical protein